MKKLVFFILIVSVSFCNLSEVKVNTVPYVTTTNYVTSIYDHNTINTVNYVAAVSSLINTPNVDYVDKIDNAEVNGLEGVSNSLAYKVEEIERHFHGRERWFGAAASPVAETHVADRMDGAILPFTLTAGNNDFGSWVQILGSEDTPVISTNVKFDAHRYMVTATNSTSVYVIQIAAGPSSDLTEKITNDQISELPYISSTNNADSGIEDVMTRRIDVGTKVWARVACVGQNGTTITIYYGIHEYEG